MGRKKKSNEVFDIKIKLGTKKLVELENRPIDKLGEEIEKIRKKWGFI